MAVISAISIFWYENDKKVKTKVFFRVNFLFTHDWCPAVSDSGDSVHKSWCLLSNGDESHGRRMWTPGNWITTRANGLLILLTDGASAPTHWSVSSGGRTDPPLASFGSEVLLTKMSHRSGHGVCILLHNENKLFSYRLQFFVPVLISLSRRKKAANVSTLIDRLNRFFERIVQPFSKTAP